MFPYFPASHEDKVAAAQAFLLQHMQLSVVSRGPRGCTVRSADGKTASAPAADVKVVDTVGAGDFFTSGFLTAYLQVQLPRRNIHLLFILQHMFGQEHLMPISWCLDNRASLSSIQGADLQQCAESGCAVGAEAVQVAGANLSHQRWAKLRAVITSIVTPAGYLNTRRSLKAWLDIPVGDHKRAAIFAITTAILTLGLGMLGRRLLAKQNL